MEPATKSRDLKRTRKPKPTAQKENPKASLTTINPARARKESTSPAGVRGGSVPAAAVSASITRSARGHKYGGHVKPKPSDTEVPLTPKGSLSPPQMAEKEEASSPADVGSATPMHSAQSFHEAKDEEASGVEKGRTTPVPNTKAAPEGNDEDTAAVPYSAPAAPSAKTVVDANTPKKAKTAVTRTPKTALIGPRKGTQSTPATLKTNVVPAEASAEPPPDDLQVPNDSAISAANRPATPTPSNANRADNVNVTPKPQKRARVMMQAGSPEASGHDAAKGASPARSHKNYARRKSVVASAVAKVVRKTFHHPALDEDEERSLTSKEQLSIFFIGGLALFFVALVLFLTLYFILKGSSIPPGVTCKSKECLRAREYLSSKLSESIDPCGDFYGYVCDSWKNQSSSFKLDTFRHVVTYINFTLFSRRKIQNFEKTQGMHILQQVYRSCYEYMSTEGDLKEAVAEARGLLYLHELTAAETFFHVVRSLVRRSLQVGISTLFSVKYVFEYGRIMVFMQRGHYLEEKLGFTLDTDENRKHFENVLKLILRRDDVTADARMVFELDAIVKKAFSTGPRTEATKILRVVVDGMVEGVTPEQWAQALSQEQRNVIPIEPSNEIITDGMEHFKAAMKGVTEQGRQKAIDYLATNLMADVVFILSMRGNISSVEGAKAYYCLQFTHRSLTLTWAYLAGHMLSPVGATDVIGSMFDAMKSIFYEKTDAFSWLQGKDRKTAQDATGSLGLDIVAGGKFNVSGVDYSGELVSQNGSFLFVLVRALEQHHRALTQHPPTLVQLLISDLEFGAELAYIAQRDTVLVPTIYQMEPYLYTSRVPEYYNYATIGYLLGSQLASVMGVGELNSADKRRASWDGDTVTRQEAVLQCLLRRRKQLGFEELSTEKADEQKAVMLILSHGLRLAHMALRTLFRVRARTAKVFNEYWPEAQRVFFVRACMIWCNSKGEPGHLTPREKCLLPLYTMREFGELYNCAGDSGTATTTDDANDGFCDI